MSKTKSGFLIRLTQNLRGRLEGGRGGGGKEGAREGGVFVRMDLLKVLCNPLPVDASSYQCASN